MKEVIKRYQLKSGVTAEDLLLNGFTFSLDGVIRDISAQRYTYINYILEDIELIIEIGINENGKLSFDDYKNVLVLDDDFCQPYYPFYDDVEGFEYLNDVIKKYNNLMDKLVKKGVLVPKELENTKTNEEEIVRKRIIVNKENN